MSAWEELVIAENIGHIETTRAWDIDGDGQLDADMRRRPRRCVLARLVDV
jgi:hypothetical protein